MTIYRDGARIGAGSTASTADAVCYEAATGSPVGGVFHTQKAQDYSTALQKWLDSNPSASFRDRFGNSERTEGSPECIERKVMNTWKDFVADLMKIESLRSARRSLPAAT
ncbi:hypothetical protein K6W21_02245 [Burkholderia latens]|uniref:hypothetical protein n=1 Tax=Burkholderia latens TaxID=488446 RepID=UPI001C979FB3|nr:hypothetical protein [Burkholderia latens]MBY4692909.1 hypothetical protein [Burkholderia latens]